MLGRALCFQRSVLLHRLLPSANLETYSHSGFYFPPASSLAFRTFGTSGTMPLQPRGPLKTKDMNTLIDLTASTSPKSESNTVPKNSQGLGSSVLANLSSSNLFSPSGQDLKGASNSYQMLDGVLVDERDFDDECNFNFETEEKQVQWSSSPPENKSSHSGAKAVPSGPVSGIQSQQQHAFGATSISQARNMSTAATAVKRILPFDNNEPDDAQEFEDSKARKRKTKRKEPWQTTSTDFKDGLNSFKSRNRTNSNNSNDSQNSALMDGPKRPTRVPRLFLSDEQQKILKMVVEDGQSVFFTGSAGTGKSVLLREIIAAMRRKYAREPDRVAVTASTGLAACNIGGVTLHSFAGIGLGKEPVEELVKKIKKNKKNASRWARTKVLIIDEVSMLDAELFDKLDMLAKALKRSTRPFGGIHLVLTGDFFQLPPVANKSDATFCFEAREWKNAVPNTICLTNVFRQKDEDFVSMLNEMRVGRLTEASIAKFRKLSRIPSYDDGLVPTELFPTRQEVELANATRMKSLEGEVRQFKAVDSGKSKDATSTAALLSNVMAPPMLELKKNAQVMLIKNIDDQLVNGSLGKVLGFMNDRSYHIMLAEDPDGDFNPKKYVESLKVDEEASPFEQRARQNLIKKLSSATAEKGAEFPLIRFTLANGCTRDLLCQPETWNIESNGEVVASRSQVPLILAYAISIHKAQGQTLDRVKVDLGRVFEKGQAYVALSRATSQEGLQVLRFDPSKVRAHPRVAGFYSSLSRAANSVNL